MWIVRLVKMPKQSSYRLGYFPRLFQYKKDALKLQADIKKIGGEATVERLCAS